MKISFITTFLNEEKTINKLLESLVSQTLLPEEILLVDGGSTDKTVSIISHFTFPLFKKRVKIITKKGNRAVGRNEAIRFATGDIIVCSDAGNTLDKNWIKNITEPFKNERIDVVSGYYEGIAKTVFQKCVIPYALVMPDKVDPNNFLPATRSIAFTKKIWKHVGGFNEKLSHNEDYAFAKSLQKANAKIVFKKNAIVYWIPRTNYKQAFIMMYRFAYGDGQARIFRPKVLFIFARYFLCILFLLIIIFMKSFFLFTFFLVLLLLYLLWAIWKNYKYVKKLQAIYILPLLQLISDWAVLKGTIFGMLRRKIRYN